MILAWLIHLTARDIDTFVGLAASLLASSESATALQRALNAASTVRASRLLCYVSTEHFFFHFPPTYTHTAARRIGTLAISFLQPRSAP